MHVNIDSSVNRRKLNKYEAKTNTINMKKTKIIKIYESIYFTWPLLVNWISIRFNAWNIYNCMRLCMADACVCVCVWMDGCVRFSYHIACLCALWVHIKQVVEKCMLNSKTHTVHTNTHTHTWLLVECSEVMPADTHTRSAFLIFLFCCNNSGMLRCWDLYLYACMCVCKWRVRGWRTWTRSADKA